MKKKARERTGEVTRASVKKEMAKPRMAKSVREGEMIRAASRMASRKRGTSRTAETARKRGSRLKR